MGESAQPCGCDAGAGWTCQWHMSFGSGIGLAADIPPVIRPKAAPVVDDRQWRKQRPLFSGVLAYFPDALLEVAYTSYVGNEQHNPGQPLHWAKEKSTDEADALMRHLAEAGKLDTDGVRHSAKVAWRALALLQREIESERVRSVGGLVPNGLNPDGTVNHERVEAFRNPSAHLSPRVSGSVFAGSARLAQSRGEGSPGQSSHPQEGPEGPCQTQSVSSTDIAQSSIPPADHRSSDKLSDPLRQALLESRRHAQSLEQERSELAALVANLRLKLDQAQRRELRQVEELIRKDRMLAWSWRRLLPSAWLR